MYRRHVFLRWVHPFLGWGVWLPLLTLCVSHPSLLFAVPQVMGQPRQALNFFIIAAHMGKGKQVRGVPTACTRALCRHWPGGIR